MSKEAEHGSYGGTMREWIAAWPGTLNDSPVGFWQLVLHGREGFELEEVALIDFIRAHIDAAWVASNPNGIFPKEHGFWISRDDVSGQFFTRPFENPGSVDTVVPGSPPPDAVAFFHTHPGGWLRPGVSGPSREDETFASRVGLPGLIQSHVGMYYFGPSLRLGR